MTQTNLELIRALLATSMLIGCGSSTFVGKSASGLSSNLLGEEDASQNADATAGEGDDAAAAEGEVDDGLVVDWEWPCGSKTKTDAYPLEAKISGSGVFLTENESDTYTIKLTGEACDAPAKPRDVLFLFDASASMKRNDRKADDGSCGRLKAMKAVAERLVGQENVRFGLITFSRKNKKTLVNSGDFYPTIDEMAAAVSASEGGDDFTDIICDEHHLGTNYDIGFGAALDLVNTKSSPDNQIDVLFVSDGKPTRKNNGAVQVDTLKQQGATIATVMVKGKEEILKDTIASNDGQGQPLYAQIEGIDLLADTLVKMVAKMMPTASLSWRMVGETDWNTTSVEASVTGTKFSAVPFPISKKTTPMGIEVEYSYYENNLVEKVGGTIKWKEAKSEPAEEPAQQTSDKPEQEPGTEPLPES